MSRTAVMERATRETRTRVELAIDEAGEVTVRTGIGMLDHLLSALAFHAGWSLQLICTGDLQVDDHHTAEDCALLLGAALDKALGERQGVQRFGWSYAPLDEALARAVVDLSGRPWPAIALGLQRQHLGELACENVHHTLVSLAMASSCALHVDVLCGSNDHHRAEAAFKAVALALRQAAALTTAGPIRVPSTKGVLS